MYANDKQILLIIVFFPLQTVLYNKWEDCKLLSKNYDLHTEPSQGSDEQKQWN